jgi:3-keto-disaccharide hydrolase
MRYVLSSAFLLAFLPIASLSQENRLTPQEESAGWRLLFNGRDMSGWDDPRLKSPPGDAWAIEDGCLKTRANPVIAEDLLTREEFGDFELAWEWRISPRGNSGLKYRIQDHFFLLDSPGARFEDLVNRSLRERRTDRPSKGQDYVIGFEYQMIDNAGNVDATAGPTHATAAIYDMVGPSRDATRPVGEFNSSRVVLKGSHVEHRLNGVKVLEGDLRVEDIAAHIAKRWGADSPVYKLLAGQPRRKCPIGLQNHGDEAWFRSIKLRPLR